MIICPHAYFSYLVRTSATKIYSMAALTFLAFYEYLTSISSPMKVRFLIERDRRLLFRGPRNITQIKWNDKIENHRIKLFTEWLKVLEGKITRQEFDSAVMLKH